MRKKEREERRKREREGEKDRRWTERQRPKGGRQ